MLRRWVAFNVVGGLGVLVQLGALFVFAGWMEWHYLLGTALAVEAALLHNFIWHELWTWADRTAGSRRGVLRRLLAFNLANGAVSIAGNLLLMRLLVGRFDMHYFLANLLTIACCSMLNFLAGDRLVFTPDMAGPGVRRADAGPKWKGEPCGKQVLPESPAQCGFSSLCRWVRSLRLPS
jgi:putative flippase GtrA